MPRRVPQQSEDCLSRGVLNKRNMPGAGIEPAWVFKFPTDFKSVASANFATRAQRFISIVFCGQQNSNCNLP